MSDAPILPTDPDYTPEMPAFPLPDFVQSEDPVTFTVNSGLSPEQIVEAIETASAQHTRVEAGGPPIPGAARAALAARLLAHVEAAIANYERDPGSAAVMRELLGKAYAEEDARERREKSGPQ